MKRALGLFAKQPTPGRVKTRLAAAVSPEWAAKVHAAFLLDSLERLATFQVHRVLAYTPPEARAYFESVAAGRWEPVPQCDGDLGERMSAFFRDVFAAGVHAALLVGADSPTLPLGLVAQAFAELARADLVLGPASDGGYYLIGCTPPVPDVFRGIDWGTSRVLGQTMARLKEHPRRLAILPVWYDVDTMENWHTLAGHVAAMRAAAHDPGSPRTEALLKETGF